MAFVIQSAVTGAFMAPDPDDGQPVWVMLLKDAHTLPDLETAVELIADHIDEFFRAQIVDLSTL